MSSFDSVLRNRARQAVCQVLNGPSGPAYVGAPLFDPFTAGFLKEQVEKLKRWACNDPSPVPNEYFPEAPFSGGQCEGVQYRVWRKRGNIAGDPSCGSSPSFLPGTFTGPIVGAIMKPSSGGGTEFYIVSEGGAKETLVGTSSFPPDQNFHKICGVERLDGQPDNCGDPDAGPPPTYITQNIQLNVEYTDNSNTFNTELGDFNVFAPVIIGGKIFAPITVSLGGIEIPLNLDINTGDIELVFDFADSPVEPVPPNPIPNPTDDEPEREGSDLVYGLQVYSVPDGPGRDGATFVDQQDGPSLRLPRTGNVYFQIPVGERVSWIGPFPVQMVNQVVWSPYLVGATGYRVIPSSGWRLEVVPLQAPPCGCKVRP